MTPGEPACSIDPACRPAAGSISADHAGPLSGSCCFERCNRSDRAWREGQANQPRFCFRKEAHALPSPRPNFYDGGKPREASRFMARPEWTSKIQTIVHFD